mmetsp:Transcript_18310/g.45866  ORF Transcript_18310/g.45866 Transcript_18310/m.45866 type:complete len:178 (-) Transcript_18310:1321-1854(-)
MDALRQHLESAKEMVGLQSEEEPQTWYGRLEKQISDSLKLSWKQRMMAFGLLAACGIGFLALSMMLLPTLVLTPQKFALSYTFGNIMLLCSSFFLFGLSAQVKSMVHPSRVVATGGYVTALVMTLISALKWRSSLLTLTFLGVQVFCFLWYIVSNLPFGQAGVMKLFSWGAQSVLPK